MSSWLPCHVMATSLDGFKWRLDRFMQDTSQDLWIQKQSASDCHILRSTRMCKNTFLQELPVGFHMISNWSLRETRCWMRKTTVFIQHGYFDIPTFLNVSDRNKLNLWASLIFQTSLLTSTKMAYSHTVKNDEALKFPEQTQ